MRHRKHTCKLNRTGSHRRCMFANMLKALIENGRIETTVAKAKELRRHADWMVSLAKEDTIAAKRRAKARLMLRYNHLSTQEKKLAKTDEKKTAYNGDRKVLNTLFTTLKDRFATRQGGYTRIIKKSTRKGDGAPTCVIEYLEN